MIRTFLFCMFFALPSLLFAQKDSTQFGSISGTVKDSADDYALQSVTVTVYKKADSTLLNYQISAQDGTFNIGQLPLNQPLYVNFSFTGYNSKSNPVGLDSVNRNYQFKNVLLSKNLGMLDDVVVKAVLPITMNGDTLEINPGAFRLDSNAVVEDMLRRVPGVTMWGDGTITVNGKTVKNVFVDSKPFFGGDPAMATQNLPKNAIDKIQVYQEQDYTKDNVDNNPTDSLLTMNIKLREDKKKGYFGKVGAGIGTEKRYEADAAGLTYTKRLRAGAALSTNNINKSANLREIFQQSTYRNYNPNNRYVANFGSAGINKLWFLGANFRYDFSEQNTSRFTDELSANYSFRNNNNFVNTQTNARNSATDVIFLQNSNQNSLSEGTSHATDVNYNKRNLDKDFSISTAFNSSNNNSSSTSTSTKAIEGGNEISESSSNNTSTSKSNGVSLNTSYRNKDADDRNLKSFGVNYNIGYSNNESSRKTLTNFISYDNASQNKNYNRLNNSSGTAFSTSLGMNYNALKRLIFGNFSLWDINMVLSNNISLSNNNNNSRVSDYDSLSGNYYLNDSLTNTNGAIHFEERPSLRFSKNFTRRLSDRFERYLNVAANVQGILMSDRNQSNLAYRNLDRQYSFFNPSVSMDYNFKKYNRYTVEMNLSGTTNPSIPNINQLKPIIDTSTSIYNINWGNANLQPSIARALNFKVNFRRERPEKTTDYNFEWSGNASNIANAIVDSSLYDKKTGRRTIYLINLNGRKQYSTDFNSGLSFKLKNNQVLQFNYNASFSNTSSPNYIDQVYTITKANNISNGLSVFYSFGDFGNVQLSQRISTSATKQNLGAFKSLRTTNYISQGNLNLNLHKDLMFSNTVNYVKNNTSNQSAVLWNAFATYRFLNSKQAEVKLSAMDILRQNKNISTNASLNNLSTTVTNGLQQFFMLTFSYYPRQFGGGRGARGERRRETGEGRERRQEQSAEMRRQNRQQGEGGFRSGGRGMRKP